MYSTMDEKGGDLMEYDKFVATRLAQLRIKKGVSARDMSISMGQSPGYINKIESGQNSPSMAGFFLICEYLEVTPMDFFDDGKEAPKQIADLTQKLSALPEKQLAAVIHLINSFTL